MNFTREPIIETIITPKEGCKLVIRSSKASGQEEYFVDSVQVIVFGGSVFYRSLEKPKPFVVPATDFEVLEVRDTKVMLKIPGVEKGGIKIGGGREANIRQPREVKEPEEASKDEEGIAAGEEETQEKPQDRKKERKRFRKRKERTQRTEEAQINGENSPEELARPREERPIIPPPPMLISETISRYKDIPSFAGAFFEKEALELEESQEVSSEMAPEPVDE